MSNQKPPPTVLQQPRFSASVPFNQRPTTPRPDPFHVTSQQPYVQPTNPTGNQGPGIRSMASTGPPNQASTPPNSDLKVSQMTAPMNLTTFPPVRGGGTQNFYRPPPPNPAPRMPNHRIQGQPPVFQHQSTPFIQPMAQPLYCMYNYNNGGQRPAIIPPQYFTGQAFAAVSYQQAPPQAQTYMSYQQQYLPRGTQSQVVPSTPQNLTQVPSQAIPLQQNSQQQLGQQKKRRAKAIPIIDPESGKDKLDEIFVGDDSHPPSGESSARQTPQPPYIPNKEVQSSFVRQVNMAISQVKKIEEMEHLSSSPLDQHLDTQSVYQTIPLTHQAVHISNNRIDLVQSSKLQLPTKEFVPAATLSNAAKETTPVVSALVDTAEVTINKQRESPVKSRKREPQVVKEPKESPVVERKEERRPSKDETKAKDPPTPILSMTVTSKEMKEANNEKEEKESQNKERTEPENLPEPEVVVESTCQQNSLPPSTPDNGKSKQKSKDAAKQVHTVPAQTPQVAPSNHKQQINPLPVPQTQPSKPNNKTNKMKELNMKGANKEGTDMDAFNDAQTENAVVATNTAAPEVINSSDTVNTTNDSNKRIECTEIPTIKSESKTLPKRIDVTDIVKEVPKPFVAPVETCDETDRIAYDNDKMVQAKNEANSKVNAELDANIMEMRPILPYKEDQWSPSNTSGKKIYDRDFLLALRNDPKSRRKPENLLDIVAQEDRGRVGDINRYPMGSKPTDFAPNFSGSNYSGKSSSMQRNPMVNKRSSQQGKSSGSSKGSKPSNVIKSISVRGDVKLNESENAWKPARFVSSGNMSDDDKKTQELYKRVRGVLNKLTPQKFDTLVHQVGALNIDTKERLQGVIDLVFEKAVDEPNFSVAYALMCKQLAFMEVPANSGSAVKKEEFVNFRKLLVTRCQMEFEKNSVDESERNAKLKDIEECTDPEKKKDLQLVLEEDDRRIRRKSVGNIRFIGELFKQEMLTVNIMKKCLYHLLNNKEEENLECLCKLLTTVGKEVEEKKVGLADIFTIIREIVDKKHGKISSRVRFMLQDVIDLRNSKWIPRRQDLNPKTIDQIQKEANDEQLTIQAMNSVPIVSRKDDRSMSTTGSGKRNTRNSSDQEGWSTPSSRSRTPFTVQSDKLKNKTPQMDEPLGCPQMFGTWTQGSNIKPNVSTSSSRNMFALLENIGNDVDKRSGMNYGKDTYHSKGTSLERNFKHTYEDGRGSRSGSQHRSHDNLQRSKPLQQQNPIVKPTPPAPKPRPALIEQISPEQLDHLERKIKNILEEYLNDCYTVIECDEDIRTSLPPSALPKLVSVSYICVLERSKTARLGTSTLFANLIKRSTLSFDNYCAGLEEVLSQADDLTIDIPKIWDYLAEIIAPIINENAVPLVRIQRSFEVIIKQGHAHKLLSPLFKLVIAEKGPNYLQSVWQNSGLSLSDFMEQSQVDALVEEQELKFLLGGVHTIVTELTNDQIHKKLLEFFENENSLDDVFSWIEANVGEKAKEKQFVRTLATAVFEDSITKSKQTNDNLSRHYSLLIRIVDGRIDHELECLYALQALINKLEHPQGTLFTICTSLYDDGILSYEAFVKWENSEDPTEQEGKGVALKQLTSFFTQLNEVDEETSSTEDA